MAENESIGGIKVDIVGDYSTLSSTMDAALEVARQGGEQVAEAFNTGAEGVDTLSKSLATAGESAREIEEKASGLADALEQVGSAAGAIGSGVATAIEGMAGAMDSAGSSAKTFEDQIQELVDSGSTLNEALAKVLATSTEFGAGIAETGNAAGAAASGLQAMDAATAAIDDGLTSAGQAAAGAAQQLQLFDEAAMVPYADAAGQLNLFADALEPIGPAATTAATALGAGTEAEKRYGDAAQSVIDKQRALEETVRTAAGALREIFEAYKNGEVNARTLAVAQEELASAVKKANGEIEDSGAKASTAADSIHKLLTELLAIGGITLSIQTLKDLGTEALEAADRIDDAGKSIARLTGSLPQATKLIADLRDVARDDALGMPELLTAATRMTAFLGTAEPVPGILRHLADSAAVMQTSITSASGAFDRIVSSGDLSKRSLLALGLTMDDVAKAMGLTATEAKKAFAAMTEESDKIDVLSVALEKFKGAAKETTDDALGGIVRLKNAWVESLEQIGAALDPIVVQALPSLTLALKGVVSAGVYVVAGFQTLAQGIAASSSVILEAVSTIGKAWLKLSEGDIAGAAAAVKSGIDNIKSAATASFDEWVADMQRDSDAINKIWEEQSKQTKKTSEEEEEAQAKRAAAAGKAAAAAVEAAAEIKKQQTALESFTKQVEGMFAKIPDTYDEYVAHLADGGQKAQAALSQVTAEISKVEAAMQHMSGARLVGMDTLLAQLHDAQKVLKDWAAEDIWNATAQKVAQLADKYTTEFGKMDAATLNWVNLALQAARDVPEALNKIKPEELLKTWLEGEKQLEESTQKLNTNLTKAWDKWREGVEQSVVPIMATLEQRLAGVDVTLQGIAKDSAAAFQGSEIGDYLNMIKGMNAEGLKTVQQLESQIATQKDLLAVMTRFHQPLQERIDLEEKIIREQIQLNDLQGKGSEAELARLNQLNIATLQQVTSLDQAEAAWSKMSATVNRFAKTDMAAALAAYSEYEATLQRVGASQGEILNVEQSRLQLEIQGAELRGKDATDQIIALYHVQLAQQALIDKSRLMGDLVVGIEKDILKGWEDVGKSIADVIVEGGNFEQAMLSIGKNVLKMIMEDLVGTAFKAMKSSLVDINAQVNNISSAFQKLGAAVTHSVSGGSLGSGEAGVEGHLLPTAGHGELPGEGSGEGAGGAATGTGGILGQLGGFASALTLVLNLLNDIIQNIQIAHLNKTMGKVEENTRYLEIIFQKYAQQDEWQRHDEILSKWDMAYTRWGDIWGELVRLKDTFNMQDYQSQIAWLWGQMSSMLTGQFNSYSTLLGRANGYLQRIADAIDPSGAAIPGGGSVTTGNVIKDNGWLWGQMQPMMVAQFNSDQSVLHSIDDHAKLATDTYLKNIDTTLTTSKGLLLAINTALGGVPKFASGTNYVPQDMLAVVHQGEAIVPAALNAAQATSTVPTMAEATAANPATATQTASGSYAYPSIAEGALPYAQTSSTTAATSPAQTVAHLGMWDMVPTIAGNQLAQMAVAMPSIPTIADSGTMLASSGPQSLSSSTTYGGVTQNVDIKVYEASNPRETARQIATTLKTLTGRLGPGMGS